LTWLLVSHQPRPTRNPFTDPDARATATNANRTGLADYSGQAAVDTPSIT
jgi:hypothetical protein